MYKVEKDYKPGFDRLVNEDENCAVLIKRLGAEVIGYDVYDEKNDRVLPLMWNNNNPEAPSDGSWGGHATVLFPLVGGIKDNKSQWGEETITTPCGHGFARKTPFFIEKMEGGEESAKIVYRITSNDKTRSYFPFEFTFEITYTLQGKNLTADFRIQNESTRAMLFQFGWHPGFSTELGVGGKKEDWQILFNKGKYKRFGVMPPGGDSYLNGEVFEEEYDGAFDCNDHLLDGTYMFEIEDEANRTCTMKNDKIGYGVKLDFTDFPQFGLWANENKPFICLEPWQGMDDHVDQEPYEKKVGIYTLPAQKEVVKSATITPLFL